MVELGTAQQELTMGLEPHSIYGYADNTLVHAAIQKRLNSLNGNKDTLYAVLEQAISALLNINDSIPVHSKHRHLVANELEAFANGPTPQEPHP